MEPIWNNKYLSKTSGALVLLDDTPITNLLFIFCNELNPNEKTDKGKNTSIPTEEVHDFIFNGKLKTIVRRDRRTSVSPPKALSYPTVIKNHASRD